MAKHPILTMSDRKQELYSLETFSRESWNDLRHALGTEAHLVLGRVAILILKPEMLVSRRALDADAFMRHHGFRPINCVRFRFSRLTAQEIWRYQWNAATTDRIRVATTMATVSDSLLIAYWDDTPHPALPASLRLWELKGPSDPKLRSRDHLRSVVGVRNKMIGFIHTCDEPADIVRELGILFPAHARANLFRSFSRGMDMAHVTPVALEIKRIEDRTPCHDLDPIAANDRIQMRAAQFPLSKGAKSQVDSFKQFLDLATRGKPLHYDQFVEHLHFFGIPECGWDPMVFAAEHIRHEYSDIKPVVDSREMPALRNAWMRNIVPAADAVTRDVGSSQD